MSNQVGAKTRKFNLAGGINTGVPAIKIDDNQSSDEYGWGADLSPALHTAKGKVVVGAQGPGWVKFFGVYLSNTLIRISGTQLQQLNSGTWNNIATVSSLETSATNFEVDGKRCMIFTNGTDAVKYWDGVTNVLTDLHASAPKGKFITNDTVRLWVAKDDILFFCGFLNAKDWTSAKNSGFIEYFTDQGGDITGLFRYQGSIMAFKKDSIAEIHGTDYNEFKLIDVSTSVGTVSSKSITEVGGILFWLGATDVYAFGGGKPEEIGEPIRYWLNRINPTKLTESWGGSDGLNYYLGLTTDSFTTPNVILSYNLKQKIWRVFRAIDTLNTSVMLGSTWYTSDVSGMTWQMTGYTNAGSAQTSMIISKPGDEGSPELEKEYYELYIQCYVPTGSTLAISFSPDDTGNNFIAIETIVGSASTMVMSTPHIIPLDTVNTLCRYARVKLVATGEVIIYDLELFFNVHPIQY